MKIAVSAETHPDESRVAATPDTIKAFVKKGFEVAVEAGAGAGAFISDEAFAGAGAKVVPRDAALKDAMAKRDLLAPAFGLWLPFGLLLIGACYLLLRALRGNRPIARRGRRPPTGARATP